MIFVPGNAGSYMQVRSIASSSSRQYHGHPDGIAVGMTGLKKRDFFAGQWPTPHPPKHRTNVDVPDAQSTTMRNSPPSTRTP